MVVVLFIPIYFVKYLSYFLLIHQISFLFRNDLSSKLNITYIYYVPGEIKTVKILENNEAMNIFGWK